MSDAHTVWSVVRHNEHAVTRHVLLGSTLCLADGRRLCLAATFGEEGEASIASLTAADLGERLVVVMPRESDAEPPAGACAAARRGPGGGVASRSARCCTTPPPARTGGRHRRRDGRADPPVDDA